MECLTALVDIRGRCEDNTAHYYYNDLPGITLQRVNASKGREDLDVFDVVDKTTSMAANLIASTIRSKLGRHYAKSVIENNIVGYYKQNRTAQTTEAGYLKGITIDINRYPYLSFYLSEISLQAQNSGATNVLIYDLTSNKLLDTIAITAVAGQVVSLSVDKEYTTNKQRLQLFIGTSADVYATDMTRGNWCSGCTGGWFGQYARFKGSKILTASDKLYENVKSQSGTSGISVTYSLNCTLDPFLCAIKNLLAMPLLYKGGAMLLQEMLHSDRLNHLILIGAKDKDRLRQDYEFEYERLMSEVLDNISLPDDICFRCARRVGTKTLTP